MTVITLLKTEVLFMMILDSRERNLRVRLLSFSFHPLFIFAFFPGVQALYRAQHLPTACPSLPILPRKQTGTRVIQALSWKGVCSAADWEWQQGTSTRQDISSGEQKQDIATLNKSGWVLKRAGRPRPILNQLSDCLLNTDPKMFPWLTSTLLISHVGGREVGRRK